MAEPDDDTPEEELEAEGAAGEPIALPIRTGPATGYSWQLELPEGVVRLDDERGSPVDPEVSLGGSAGGSLRVTARRGDHVIAARLARPWQPDEPIRRVRIRLRVR